MSVDASNATGDDALGDDETAFYDQTLRHAFEVWITPEVKKRQANGKIPRPFNLIMAQVLFKDDGVEVRLNSEVKGQIRLASPTLTPGQPVTLDQVTDIEAFELPLEDMNYGHFTVLHQSDKWTMMFDFERNRAIALGLVEKAYDFLAVARFAAAITKWAPFGDCLFSACELLSKAQLITSVLNKNIKTHKPIHSAINQWGRLGNARRDFVDLFNQLGSHRGSARYSPEAPVMPTYAVEGPDIVAREIDTLKNRLRRKVEEARSR